MTFVASSPSEAVLPVLQRTRGEAVVGFRSARGRTVLDRLRQDGAAKVRLPRLSPGEPAQAVLINTAGGFEKPKASAAGAAPMLQWVPISDLVVDPGYQRPIVGKGRRNVDRIARSFSWSCFAPVP